MSQPPPQPPGNEPGWGPPSTAPGWGQSPPPGHGPPAGPGAPGGRKTPNPVILVVVVLVVVVAAVGGYLLLSGGDDSGRRDSGESSAEDVARAYADALIDRDCGRLVGMMSLDGAGRAEAEDQCAAVFGSTEGSPETEALLPVEVVSTLVESETASTATVSVEMRAADDSMAFEVVELVDHGDGWLVDPVTAGL